MSSNMIQSSQIHNNNSSNNDNHNITDVLLYAESKITRKQAVREIADVILRANMKPRTVKHALQLLKILLPPENTLPATVDELFGAMLSSENDWRLAQYLIRHKQRPSFLSSPNIWNENSNISLTAASSSSMSRNQEFNITAQSSSLVLPVSSSSESSSSSSSSSASSDDDDDDDDDDDERNILLAIQGTQQQRLINSSPLRPVIENVGDVENNLNNVISINNNESSDQRSQIVSNSFSRFPLLGSFKRQRSETSSDDSSSSEPDLFYSTRLSDDDDDDDDSDNETPFYPISNKNNNNNKSCCFEMNGYDLLAGGKRRRH
ncbi:unnamed protein product [Rotaria sordida]|uniref:Uncharacterized protein n=1 Tax=Rotaria sordida TaxID=392033 RepID=A0A815RJD5_9BILA|nr:unnamed protein product [Rotaria sordida]CAF1478398.1 unnamed protein product [Rotaria sordida]